MGGSTNSPLGQPLGAKVPQYGPGSDWGQPKIPQYGAVSSPAPAPAAPVPSSPTPSYPMPAAPAPGMPSATNPYQGQPLAQNVQSAYTTALNNATNMAGGNAFTLAGTDLSSYMNPYQQNVIDTTMGELGRQEDIAQQGVDDATLAQGAYGGDRMYLQKGVMNDLYNRTRASTLAGLNQSNFNNAQQMGQFDVGNRNIASSTGLANMGNLANMGFGWGDTLNKNQLASGALQQQQQQQIMNAIKAQFGGYTGAPGNALQTYLSSILSPNSGTGTSSTNPGLLGYLGAAANIAGAFI